MSKAIIFDFDGTLVDSEKSIYKCFQSITKQLAPERVNYAENILIGPPLRDTASEILGPRNQNQLDKFVELFIQMHDEQVIQHTQPYPDVIEVLKKLYAKNILMAIATNKRLVPTKKLIDHFGWEDYFLFIECSNSEYQIRNKNEMIKDILGKAKFPTFKEFTSEMKEKSSYSNYDGLLCLGRFNKIALTNAKLKKQSKKK